MEEEPLFAERDQCGHQRHFVGKGVIVVAGVEEEEVEEKFSLDLKMPLSSTGCPMWLSTTYGCLQIESCVLIQGIPCPRRLGFVDLDLECSTTLLGQ